MPFPKSFRETLPLYAANAGKLGYTYLFESSWKKPYFDRILEKCSWLKKKGKDDALIQPYPGYENRASLQVYSKLSLSDAQDSYDENIKDFSV